MKSSNGSLKISFNNKRRRFHLGQPFYPLCILTLLALIAYPLGAVLLQSVFPNLFDQGFYPFSLQSFVSMFTETYTYQSIVNAFLFGSGSALIAAVLGTFFAVLIHRQRKNTSAKSD
ncbi:hypothetical protein [Sporolactobacillus pectinivorans]|uniref:hypothetical protein n=1 Tax=Sporolactobacillus pectinivorans TaxID=1591408 RepID=UPI000C2688FC|nr:hypothetical protein [Sporolactobacillus pectinivorans]